MQDGRSYHKVISPFLASFLSFSSIPVTPLLSLSRAHPLRPARGPWERRELRQWVQAESDHRTVSVHSEMKRASDVWWRQCWRGLEATNFSYKSQGRPKFCLCRTTPTWIFWVPDQTPTTATVAAPLLSVQCPSSSDQWNSKYISNCVTFAQLALHYPCQSSTLQHLGFSSY